jgi:hypothetical protein
MMLDKPLLDDRNKLEDCAQPERAEGDAEKALASPKDRDNCVQEAERIKPGSDAKPDKTGFAHDLSSTLV